MNKDFDHLYEQQLKPVLDNLETTRKEIHSKIIRYTLYSIVFLIPGIYFATLIDKDHEWYVVLAFFTLFIAVALPGYNISLGLGKFKKIKHTFKNKVLVELLLFLYDKVEFLPRQRFSTKVIENSGILDNRLAAGDLVEGEDYVKCIIGNTTIQFAEMYVFRSDYIFSKVLFQGIFISAKFNKILKHKTLVFSRRKLTNTRKFRLKLQSFFNDGHIITLENSKFNELFVVYGEDEIETRYVLSSSMMEKLIAYQEKLNKDIAFSFVENRMYAAIYTNKNHFEPSISKPLNDKTQIVQHFELYKMLTDMVLDLDLKLRLWDKLE